MLGVVLAGGHSRRMGRTKALVEVDGLPMARRVADALRAGGCDPIVIVGGDPAELGVLGLPVVDDLHPGEGPLGGVLTALALLAGRDAAVADDAGIADGDAGRVADDAVVVAACDLPWLSSVTVAELLAASARRPDAQVVMARGDHPEPALAIWRASAHDRLRLAFDEGERALFRAVRSVGAVDVDVAPAALRNVNTPGDLPR
jgi:molybdopterin-guanine dinucleotide biosynthesis protein A